jgi:hypothetical protein
LTPAAFRTPPRPVQAAQDLDPSRTALPAQFARRAQHFRFRPHGGNAVTDQWLQAGEELVLDGGVRLVVLAVEDDVVSLGIVLPEGGWVVAPQAPDGRFLRQAALTAAPGSN